MNMRKSLARHTHLEVKCPFADKLEITPIGNNAAAVTGWATISVTPIDGKAISQRYIFTMTFVNDGAGWKRIIAQKSVLKEDS
jgi:hypothetical protein